MIPPVLRAPLAVRFPLRPGWRLRAFLFLPGAASALLLAGWGWLGAHRWPLPALALALVAWLLAAAVAWRAERRHPQGWLGWDGSAWCWHPPAMDAPGPADGVPLRQAPDIAWDGQSFLWVALGLDNGRRMWCLLDRDADPQRWADLRRALYFRPKSGVPVGASAAGPGPGASPL